MSISIIPVQSVFILLGGKALERLTGNYVAPKSARITLSFGRNSDGPQSVGYFNILGMTFALYQAWLYMSVFSATKTFGSDAAGVFVPLAQSNHAVLVYVFLAASAALLVAFGLLRRQVAPFFEKKRSVAIAGTLGTAGTLMLQLGAGSYVPGVALAALCMGACASMFVILLGNAFARFEFATCVLDTAVSVALGFICAVAFVNWVPSPAAGFVSALMPILMSVAFWKRAHSEPGSAESGIDSGYLLAYLRKFVASMMLFGIVMGALRVVCADRLLSGGITIELVLAGSCIAGVLLFMLVIAASKKETLWDSLFRVVTPVVFLGIACMVTLTGSLELLSAFFTVLGFVCLAALLWIFLASIARSLNGSSIFVFGTGYGLMQATSIAGCVLANALLSDDPGMMLAVMGSLSPLEAPSSEICTICNITLLALLLCVILSLAYAVSPRYREMRELFSSALSDMLQSSRRAEDAGAPNEELAYYEAEHGTDGEPSRTECENAAPVDVEEDTQEQPVREEKGSFVRRCDELSDTYGLSVREKEVFFLLAKGHNAAFITDKLCVSKSTAKTHINHIYKKMDIHTQQELLTMVEDRARGPLGADIDRDALREALKRASEEGSLERNPSGQVKRDYIGF